MQLLPHRLFLSRAKLLTLGAFLYGHNPLVDALSPVTFAFFSFETESTLLDTTGQDLQKHNYEPFVPLDLVQKDLRKSRHWLLLPVAFEDQSFFLADHGQKCAFSLIYSHESTVGCVHHHTASCMGIASPVPCCIQGSHQLMAHAYLRSSST